MGQILFHGMKKHAKSVVQIHVDTDEHDTYEAVLQRAVRTAIAIKDKFDIKQGDIISTCTHRHINSCIPMIATQFLGAISCGFNFRITPEVTISLLKLIQPKLMFIDIDVLPTMEKCLKTAKIPVELIVFGKSDKYLQFEEFLKPNPLENQFQPATLDDIHQTAALFLTSGTTGIPKAICVNHSRFSKIVLNQTITNKPRYESNGTYMISSNLNGAFGVSFFLTGVLNGSTMILYDTFDARKTWTNIEKYRINVIFLVPHLAAEFIANRPKNPNIGSLKVFLTGTCPVPKKLMNDIYEALPNVAISTPYGSTEAEKCISYNLSDEKERELQRRKPLSIGFIMKDCQWKLIDPETEQPLGPNQEGELRIKSDLLMNGYYKMDSSTDFDSNGYYKTGDIFYYDDENCFYFVDRYKSMFKCRGIQIVPSILENVLSSHPSVKEAIVIGVKHETDGRRPMGIVVLKDGNDGITAEQIERFVDERVYEPQRLIGGVRFVKELPKGATGKVQRRFVQENFMNL